MYKNYYNFSSYQHYTADTSSLERLLGPDHKKIINEGAKAFLNPNKEETMSENEIVFWDCDEAQEYLTHTKMDNAVEYHLDALDNLPLGEVINVFGFKKERLSPENELGLVGVFGVLESFLDNLDANYGGEDSAGPTPKMIQAEKVFIEAVLAEYEVWRCYWSDTERIDVTEWVTKNRPNWLEHE